MSERIADRAFRMGLAGASVPGIVPVKKGLSLESCLWRLDLATRFFLLAVFASWMVGWAAVHLLPPWSSQGVSALPQAGSSGAQLCLKQWLRISLASFKLLPGTLTRAQNLTSLAGPTLLVDDTLNLALALFICVSFPHQYQTVLSLSS